MTNRYFKSRQPFTLRPHRYDIGIFTGLKKGYEDNLFIRKLLGLDPSEYPEFYQYHRNHYCSRFPDGEQEFFAFVSKIIQHRITYIERKSPFDREHARDMAIAARLSRFQEYLRSDKHWPASRSLTEIIAEQHRKIESLKKEISNLQAALLRTRKLDTKESVSIREGYLMTFLDLCLKLQDLRIPGTDKELVFSQTQTIWCKIIARYFREGKREIPYETLRRYFPANRKNLGRKYAILPSHAQLFAIHPVKNIP